MLSQLTTNSPLGRSLRHLLVAACAALAIDAHAKPRWQTLPPTPAPVAGEQHGVAEVNGIRLYYATIGKGSPVVLLHGGLSNSDYFGHQVRALMKYHKVVLVDSRGHGRSTRSAQPYGYDLMADDVVALMDKLKIDKADILGWSDGAIIGLDLAIHHPERLNKVVAFAANTKTEGVVDGVEKNPTFAAFIKRAGNEYRLLSATPDGYDAFVDQIGKMWATQPNWSDEQLRAIKTPVLVLDGDRDEAIKRIHTEYIAATIPGAALEILPAVSHFAFLQDPAQFNYAVLHFFGDE